MKFILFSVWCIFLTVFNISSVLGQTLTIDSDKDGLTDDKDNCPTISNDHQQDKDKDGLGNECDDDIDGDGFSNNDENEAATKVWDAESYPVASPFLSDVDNDKVADRDDNCITLYNPNQNDFDNDNAGDNCDLDIDGDLVINAKDHCPNTSLSQPVDSDGCTLENINNSGTQVTKKLLQLEDYISFTSLSHNPLSQEPNKHGLEIQMSFDIDKSQSISNNSSDELFDYNVELPPASYELYLRLASSDESNIEVAINSSSINKTINSTGSNNHWQTIHLGQMQLSSSSQTLRLRINEGHVNLNWLDIQLSCSNDHPCLDEDNDGIRDSLDTCPNTSNLVEADNQGCPLKVTEHIPYLHKHRYTQANTQEKKVALTFNDGPYGQLTYDMVEFFSQNDMKVTFFHTGTQALQYPDAVKHVIKTGNQIGNHAMSNVDLISLNKTRINEEISGLQDLYRNKFNYQLSVFRAPHLSLNEDVWSVLKENQLPVVDLSVSLEDWGDQPEHEIKARLMDKIHSGAIILAHEREKTFKVLKSSIPSLKAQGYEFVTLNELINNEHGN